MPPEPRGPRPDCPVCGEPCRARVKRPAAWLATCGQRACGDELRARGTRGRAYGNRGGGPGRSDSAGHNAVHARARRAFRGRGCSLADDTCRGRIEAALRADVPRELLATDPRTGDVYYPGPNTEDAYRPLCRSHHAREGALSAAASRSARVAGAVVADRVRQEHDACTTPCDVCTLLKTLDAALAGLVALEARAVADRAAAHPSSCSARTPTTAEIAQGRAASM